MAKDLYMVKYKNDDVVFVDSFPSDLTDVVQVLHLFCSDGMLEYEWLVI